MDQAVSFLRFVRISSAEQDMFNFFQTFSAADLHWDDLHRLFDGAKEKYLGKSLVDSLEQVPPEQKPNCIEKTVDYLTRAENLKKNADLIDWYFYHRLQVFKIIKQFGCLNLLFKIINFYLLLFLVHEPKMFYDLN